MRRLPPVPGEEAVRRRDLIDEFNFFVNPVALGKGVQVFDRLDRFRPLKLARSKTYDSGIVLLRYERG
jgi:dihydrofolate reductase